MMPFPKVVNINDKRLESHLKEPYFGPILQIGEGNIDLLYIETKRIYDYLYTCGKNGVPLLNRGSEIFDIYQKRFGLTEQEMLQNIRRYNEWQMK